MTTSIYTGSNFGVISTVNSGTGTLASIGNTTSFSYENATNYSALSVLISLTGAGNATLRIYGAKDNSGTNEQTQELQLTKTGSQNLNFYPNGAFVKVELEANEAGITYDIQTRYLNSAVAPPLTGILSVLNSYIQPSTVSASATLSGTYEDVSDYAMICITPSGTATTPGVSPGTLNLYFSADASTTDRVLTIPVQDITDSSSRTFNPIQNIIPLARYFKLDYVNGTNELSSIRLTTQYHKTAPAQATIAPANQGITDYWPAQTQRALMVGRTAGTTLTGGRYEIASIQNQALSVRIQEPLSAFGELLNTEPTPIVQIDFSNGFPLDISFVQRNSTTNTSYAIQNGSATIGVSAANSIIRLLSRQYSKYKTGQGLDGRFTCIFTGGYTAGANKFVGLTNTEDQIGFGYFDSAVSGTTEFCIQYRRHGLTSIRAFDISGTATSGGTITYTFGGTNVVVAFTTGQTAKDIARASSTAVLAVLNLNTYGWLDDYFITGGVSTNATILFYSNQAANIAASAVSSGAGITITTNTNYTRNGQAATTTYIPQSSWNLDRCTSQATLQDAYDYNPSGFALDPTKGNVYRVNIQYLGFGAITFMIENPNTGQFIPVHQIQYANQNTITNMGIPSYRVGHILENTTNATSLTMVCASLFTAIHGKFIPSPIYRAYAHTLTTNDVAVARSSPRVIYGLKGRNVFQSLNSDGSYTNVMNRNNNIFATFSGSSITAKAGDTATITFALIKNPTSITYSSTSAAPPWKITDNNGVYVFDGVTVTSTTGVTYTGGEVIVEFCINDNSNVVFDLSSQRLFMTPDDTILIVYYGGFTGQDYDLLASLSWFVNQ